MAANQFSYSPAEIVSVSDVTIAQHLERLERIDYALDQNHQADGRTTSDWGSQDGMAVQIIAREVTSIGQRTEHPLYSTGVLYAMQIHNPFNAVRRLPRLTGLYDERQARDQMQEILEIDGYERAGGIFLERSDKKEAVIPTLGAFAAYSYRKALPKANGMEVFVSRANEAGVELTEANLAKLAKNDPLVMEFYKRRISINYAKLAISMTVPLREASTEAGTGSVFSDRWGKPENTAPHDTAWWWNELVSDLTSIDEAAASELAE